MGTESKRKRLKSLSYSDYKSFTSCKKQFWFRYSRVKQDMVVPKTKEEIIGDIVHRVLSGEDHQKRVKKLVEKYHSEGALQDEDLVKLEKQIHKQAKSAKKLKKEDLSKKTKAEKKFYFDYSFVNAAGERVECTLVTKPDRIGTFIDNKGRTIPEIGELKTTRPHHSHLQQLLYAAATYSRHNGLPEALTVACRLVLDYAPKPGEDGQPSKAVHFAGQHRLETFLEEKVRPVIEEINERIVNEDFPASTHAAKCIRCPFASQCEEYQASIQAA